MLLSSCVGRASGDLASVYSQRTLRLEEWAATRYVWFGGCTNSSNLQFIFTFTFTCPWGLLDRASIALPDCDTDPYTLDHHWACFPDSVRVLRIACTWDLCTQCPYRYTKMPWWWTSCGMLPLSVTLTTLISPSESAQTTGTPAGLLLGW